MPARARRDLQKAKVPEPEPASANRLDAFVNAFPVEVKTPSALAKSGTFNSDDAGAAYHGAFINGVQHVKQNMARCNVVGHATRAGL